MTMVVTPTALSLMIYLVDDIDGDYRKMRWT